MPTNLRPHLDPDVIRILDAASDRPPIDLDSPPHVVRDQQQAFNDWMRGETDPQLAAVPTRDELIAGPADTAVPIRWYGRQGDVAEDVVVYIHGGGWTAGSIDAYDRDIRLLHHLTGLTVASIEYRRTPEHTFPTPLDDCVTVVRALASRRNRTLSIAGDSAGGNLALGTALALRDDHLLDAMLLIYPVVDPEAFDNTSYTENGRGYLLESDGMRRFWEMYAPQTDERTHPLAAPARADLRGLPPAVVVSAGYDPLRDEDRELAARLIDADVQVTHLPNPTLTHGFQQMTPRIPAATSAIRTVYATFTSVIRHNRNG